MRSTCALTAFQEVSKTSRSGRTEGTEGPPLRSAILALFTFIGPEKVDCTFNPSGGANAQEKRDRSLRGYFAAGLRWTIVGVFERDGHMDQPAGCDARPL